MSLPSPLEKGDHEVVDEVCIETTFPSPPLRVPSPRRGLDADSGEQWFTLPSPSEKGDHEVVDEVCIVITFPSPPLRVPSPRRGLEGFQHNFGHIVKGH